jgi:hypothetical protein
VVLPGGRGAGAQPVLAYGRAAVQQRGWSALVVWDEYRGSLEDGGERRRWVADRALAALRHVRSRPVLLMAKSLSSFAAGLAAEHELPAIWYTPLLSEPDVVEDLSRASAPSALVGGTADEEWVSAVAATLPATILQLDGADHGLELPGDALGSVGLLKQTVGFTGAFVDQLEGTRRVGV